MQLDQLRSVAIDETKMQVTVGGGCNLGYDPFDPSHTSSDKDNNNLFFQLHQKGLAIPNVADETHQTVAGFISTGSSAGSMIHSFDECILSVRLVDGTGKIQTFTRSADLNDPFYGVIVSMGLMGIITSVTLQCVPAFTITGTETTTAVTDCEFDFFGSGSGSKLSASKFFSTTEFTRTMWWPYQTLHRAVVWKAKTMGPADFTSMAGTQAKFVPKPYTSIFPSVEGSTFPAEAVASTGFTMIASWPSWFNDLVGKSSSEQKLKALLIKAGIETAFPYVYPLLIDIFMPINNSSKPAKTFWDYWYKCLPMDKVEFSNNLFDLAYAEMWMPMDQAGSILTDMQNLYEQKGYAATGFFTTEIFAAKKSDFWLSPAYDQDSIRINLLWFAANIGEPMKYFQEFWDLFAKYEFRPHWGKNLPPATDTNVNYLKSRYPRWNDWLKLRGQLDPNQIFMTTYWRTHLGVVANN